MSEVESIQRAHSLGSLPRNTDKPVKAEPADRTCLICHRPLSIYNPDPICNAHPRRPVW